MISDRIEHMTGQILVNTKAGLINWRPIKDYWLLAKNQQNEEFFERIQMLRVNEFVDFYEERSFYALKGEYLIAILHYAEYSAYDASSSEEREFVGAINTSSCLMSLPCYLDGGIDAIQSCVEEYWNNFFNSEAGMSEVIELFEAFSETE